MKSSSDRELDAITARATHDPAMRNILSDLGLTQSNPAELRAAMEQLDQDTRDELTEKSEELEQESGRTNAAYLAVADDAQQVWTRLIKPLYQEAEAVMQDMPAAMEAIKNGRDDVFQHYRQSFSEKGEHFQDELTGARNELRRSIRQSVKENGLNLDTAARAPLVDHLTRSAPVPAKITEVMVASGKLEAAKSQHDLAAEQRRHMGAAPTPSPKASYSM